MTQLAANVDANDELWTLDTMPTTRYVQVQDEIVEIRATYPEHIYQPTQELLPPKIRVRRGQSGTTAASHNSATTLTPVYGQGGTGAGGVTVDNQVDDPAEVTTLIAPGATIDGDEATLANALKFRLLGPFRVTHEDVDLAPAGGWEQIIRVGEPIAVGSLCLAWVVLLEDWNNLGTDHFINLDVYGPHGAGANTPGTLGEAVYGTAANGGGYGFEGGASGYGVAVMNIAGGDFYKPPTWFVARDPLTLTAKINYGSGAGTPTAGEMDVYALIAEPAS